MISGMVNFDLCVMIEWSGFLLGCTLFSDGYGVLVHTGFANGALSNNLYMSASDLNSSERASEQVAAMDGEIDR